MTSLRAHCFWVPKEGNRVEEWEDACAFSEANGRFAIADGASSSFRAQDWASALTKSFVAQPPTDLTTDGLESWVAGIAESFDEAPAGDSWYHESAAERGAFATLLGLFLGETARGSGALGYMAVAVGDTCMFHIRGGKLAKAWPLTDASQFTSTPQLVASTVAHQGHGAHAAIFERGAVKAGDVFILATDALSHWALAMSKEDETVWQALCSVRNDTFQNLVTHLRGARVVENDDLTLLRIEVLDGR